MDEKIKGPVLSKEQIGIINEIKTVEASILQLVSSLKDQDKIPVDIRWLSIGITDLEKGFMSIVKGICNGN